MENVLIGVGGTGARVLEAFAYLSAAGVLGEKIPKVNMRMIEMDTDNGNLGRLHKILESYSNCYGSVFSHVRDWKARKIIYKDAAPFVWQVGVEGDANTLAGKFNQGTENKDLLHGLYGSEDLHITLEKGCKGRPRVGALEYTKRFNDDIKPDNSNSFWNNLFTGDIMTAQTDGTLRVMLTGSMFGGSGASGVPNLAKLIKRKFCVGNGNEVGLTLMSPFFNYNDTAVIDNFGAESRKFMINSKAALLYYDQSDILDEMHSLYVIGGKVKPMKKSDGSAAADSAGAKSQCNPAMPALLVAALSAIDFFLKADNKNAGQSVIANTNHELESDWRSYPYNEELKKGLIQLQRLSLLWRVIGDKAASTSSKSKDWESLCGKYIGLMGGGKQAFNPSVFLEKTSGIREFFLGQVERTEPNMPWNIGAEGFLQELEKNGMGEAIDITKDIIHVDKMRFDNPVDVAAPIAGIPFRDLHDNLTRNSSVNVGKIGGDEERRAKFIAGATLACLLK